MQQMSASKNHLEPFSRALEQAAQMCEQTDQECELKLLRVPALNFEASGSATRTGLRIQMDDHMGA